jgi:hypothetical protein
MHREWFGDELGLRVDRASARAIVGIAEAVAVETKRVTHVISGTLRRSVHAAPVGYDGSRDEEAAKRGDMMLGSSELSTLGSALGSATLATLGVEGAVVEVGSWLPYACVEWVGRQHPGVTQGLESVRGPWADIIVAQAFREEGL